MTKTRKTIITLINSYITLISAQVIACDKIDSFVNNLPREEKIVLEYFAQSLLKSDDAAYVLFGDKPLCVGYAYDSAVIPMIKPFDRETIQTKGLDFLNGLNIQKTDKKYPIIQWKTGTYTNFIFINRDSFIKTVNKNINLFRYALSRTLTGEELLNELIENGDSFSKIIRNTALLGILLGFGTQNSLIVSREDELTNIDYGDVSCFPFKNIKSLHDFQIKPSIGFCNLEEEYEKLYSLTQISTHLKPFDSYTIPHFGCDQNLKETQHLLSLYEKNRKEIVKIGKSQNILSKLLKRLCTTVSNRICIPPSLEGRTINKWNEDILPKLTEYCIYSLRNSHSSYAITREEAIHSFIEGIKQFQKRKTSEIKLRQFQSYEYEFFKEFLLTATAIKKIANQNDIIELIPGYVYHKILVNGKGSASTDRIKNATFNFSIYKNGDYLLDCGTLKNIKLNDLIPGIAYSLIGMKKGEEKEIYIHPKYSYGLRAERTIITAHVKLLDFEEGIEKTSLPEPYLEDIFYPNNFLLDLKKFGKHLFYARGSYFYHLLKENGVKIEPEDLIKSLSENRSILADREGLRQFIISLNCYLLSCDHDRGIIPQLE